MSGDAAGSGQTDSIACTGIAQADFPSMFIVESTAEWLTVGAFNGNTIQYSYSANENTAERKASIKVSVSQETYDQFGTVVHHNDAYWAADDPTLMLVFDVIQAGVAAAQ